MRYLRLGLIWLGCRLCAHSKPATPALPLQTVDTRLSSTPITGRRILVAVTSDIYANGRALQRAIDDAALGDVVLVPPAVYVCAPLTLRKKMGAGWLTIEALFTDLHLPSEGNRISPDYTPYMPTLISPGGNAPVIRTESGAHNYRLVGLNITKLDPAAFVQELMVIDSDTLDYTKVADMDDFPKNIIIDRCYIHGSPSNELKRGIRFYCFSCAVINSYISEAHVLGQEAQAILFAGGPLRIENNYLEAAGENLFAQDYLSLRTASFTQPPTTTSATLSSTLDLAVGDGISIWDGRMNVYTHVTAIAGTQVEYEALNSSPSPTATVYWGRLPTDIEIDHNYLFKPLSWNPLDQSYAGYHPTVKNIFELKSGRRVWFHNNLLNNIWPDAQDGSAILLTVRNQTGDCYFCAVEDVTLQDNIITNATKGLLVLSTDYIGPSGPTQVVLVSHNLFLNVSGFQENTIDSEMIDHNTMSIGGYAMSVEQGAARDANQFTNNVVMSRWASGMHYNDGTPPDWNVVFKNWIFRANVFSRVDGIPTFLYMPSFESANFEVASAEDVDFVDWQHQDLALSPGSWARSVGTDGGPIGADVASLMSNRESIVSGILVGDEPGAPVLPPIQDPPTDPVSPPAQDPPISPLPSGHMPPPRMRAAPQLPIKSILAAPPIVRVSAAPNIRALLTRKYSQEEPKGQQATQRQLVLFDRSRPPNRQRTMFWGVSKLQIKSISAAPPIVAVSAAPTIRTLLTRKSWQEEPKGQQSTQKQLFVFDRSMFPNRNRIMFWGVNVKRPCATATVPDRNRPTSSNADLHAAATFNSFGSTDLRSCDANDATFDLKK